MRWISGFERSPDLIAWWQFNEPGDNVDHGHFAMHKKALDASGHGNDLSLITEPQSKRAQITAPDGTELSTGLLQFRNNFALQKEATNMPAESFTVEFWARGGAIGRDTNQQQSSTLFSYATESVGRGKERTGFMDDALRIERLMSELAPSWITRTSTVGAVALHLNSNEHTDSADGQSFVYFDAGWTDDKWHHIAATWDSRSGAAALYFDGKPTPAIWKSQNGASSSAYPDEGMVDPILSPMTQRAREGSVVLAQDQDCFGGCFSSSDAFKGDMAAVRVWGRALGVEEIGQNMARARPESTHGLAAMYVFDSDGLRKEEGGTSFVVDRSGSGNHLELRSAAPQYVYSTAPLSFSNGKIVSPPRPGGGGYSLALNDKQVLLATDFQNFPSTAITVEFWMLSIDTCRPGVPFSYAAGDYAKSDNSFLLFNYNSWGVSVMEDEGVFGDHLSGISATDGNWHHVAVTWDSLTGKVVLYDNGRPQWVTYRGKGRTIPSGGTLVIGREQDCTGGCFDSASGAAGRTSEVKEQEYGAQDFFGIIEEMRVWSVVRSAEEIRAGMEMDDGRGPGGFYSPGVDPSTPGLVAYWKFDEGAGYLVHDASGNSHHLSITQPPKWEVTRWLSTCGNAVVEGEEQCDDGDLTDGDGCSATCMIEPGWTCAHSPSKCQKKSEPPAPHAPETQPKPTPKPSPRPPPPRQPDPAPRRDTGEQESKQPSDAPSSPKKRSSAVTAVLATFASIGVLAVVVAFGLVTMQRTGRVVPEALSRAGGYVSERVISALPVALRERVTGYSSLSNGLYFAPNEDMQGAPDFMAFSSGPQRYRHLVPGAPGPYAPLNSDAKASDGAARSSSGGGENALV